MKAKYEVVVVGAGPNGLAAAICLARAGLSTVVFEASSTAGGGARSAALTLPGVIHDVCSTVHPLGAASPLFRSLALDRFGLTWVQPACPVAHVLDDGSVVTLERSVAETAEQLGRDGKAYSQLLRPFVEEFDSLLEMILGPLRFPAAPPLLARFGLQALRSMRGLAASWFREAPARALLAGIGAHAMVPLDSVATASFALVLAAAGHAVGWPLARAGSQTITDALLACYQAYGGHLVLDQQVDRLEELPPARAYVLDLTPRQVSRVASRQLPAGYCRRLARFRYGPGVFKMDWTLAGPIPWKAAECARAATVHLSGNLPEIATAEALIHQGRLAQQPFILLVQPSLFDPSRAPPGIHTAWAYCHVPHGSTVDASNAIESHIERYAPGFRRSILARATRSPAQMEAYDANYIGGDINGGMSDFAQLLFRPVFRADPYATPSPQIFLCSSSTPPGGGVHGMCGYWAARSVLKHAFRGSDATPLGTSV
jgi:phytoene dehydrogenase-like protein